MYIIIQAFMIQSNLVAVGQSKI